MSKVIVAFSALAIVCAAAPASATIVIYSTPGVVQPDENVLFQGPPPSGNNAFGVTSQTNLPVTFTGNELLATPSSGQARITGADGNLSQLAFALGTGLGFTEVEFNIFGTQATATSVMLNFTDQFGTVFSDDFAIGRGQNFFSARAFDDQFITNVSFTLNGDVRDVRQFRIGGIGSIDDGGGAPSPVPEPQSWLLLMAGFGLVGASLRRRQAHRTVAA
ncbi:hypothetical protein GCM10011529_14850 [Polymorphobacter glacialis]|uniref:Ice-binding protein C-terminal domain-containing protein n=1 Tax=Sandarakinorhabdus glacialis TaxID=1614636 RepID=A0A917E7X1_9SPHN|nr:PEPxxWA-CTERM sorting domain-containing protein [Polymorphobacter glacialis]GGE09563.1 hypothetical protein GCM10011529_14850 [Polymorphobacter glacialis]